MDRLFDLRKGKCCKSRLGVFEDKGAQTDGGGKEMVPEEPLAGYDGGMKFVQVGDDLDDDLLSEKVSKIWRPEEEKRTYVTPFHDSKVGMTVNGPRRICWLIMHRHHKIRSLQEQNIFRNIQRERELLQCPMEIVPTYLWTISPRHLRIRVY